MNKRLVNRATFIGSGALLLWVIQPLLVAELEGFPIFEGLSLIFGICFILTAIRITLAKRWSIIRQQSWFVWILGLLGICGGDFCYLLGAYSAPIAHVDLIDYLWPCIFVIFIGFIPNEKFSWKYLVGSLMGLVGVLQLITVGGFNMEYALGYCLALYGVIIWGVYSIISSQRIEIPTDMVGVYCGIGAIISIILHLSLETTVIPTFEESSIALTLSIAGPGLAYQLWDHGIKFGNARLLSILCYLARVVAMILLVWFGKEPFSNSLVIASILAVTGVVICSADENLFKEVFTKVYKKISMTINARLKGTIR